MRRYLLDPVVLMLVGIIGIQVHQIIHLRRFLKPDPGLIYGQVSRADIIVVPERPIQSVQRLELILAMNTKG